jgi:hypothetical protein
VETAARTRYETNRGALRSPHAKSALFSAKCG